MLLSACNNIVLPAVSKGREKPWKFVEGQRKTLSELIPQSQEVEINIVLVVSLHWTALH